MFYPIHLLSHRNKGKLAPCWLAAMHSEKSFKKYYKSVTIKKINITITCEEILQIIQLRDTQRFSLYLSSQLMYGIIRIFSYQIAQYQKDLLEIWKIFNYTTELNREENFNALRAFDTLPEIELPLLDQRILDLQINEDLHILPGEIPDDRLDVIMQDAMCLNFGALTDKELDFMLEHDITHQIREAMQITDDSKQKNVTEMITDVEIASEIHLEMHSPRAISSPMLVDKTKIIDKSKTKLLSTPQKRQPHQLQAETPTKRRRISLENIELPIVDTAIDVVPALPEDVSEQALTRTLSVRNIEMTVPLQHVETDMNMELESIHLSFDRFMIKKKNLVIDKNIMLTGTVLNKWRQDINFQCTKIGMPLIHKIPYVHFLKQPSNLLRCKSRCAKILCAQSLLKLFVNHTEKPCKSANEDIAPVLMQSQEEIRGLQRTVEEHTEQTTSKLIEPEEPSTEQLSAAPIQTLWVADEPLHQKTRVDVSDANDSLEDIDNLLEKMQALSTTKDQISVSSVRSTDKSQHTFLTSQDVLAMLEVLWHNKPYAKFSDLISKNINSEQNTYTKQDAATAFCILLKLHAQKKLILHQTEFFHTLWIQKYEDYMD